MAKYLLKVVSVEALKILSVEIEPELEVPVSAKLEDGSIVELPNSLTAHYHPVAGDYYVTKPDGFVKIMGKKEFVSRYAKEK